MNRIVSASLGVAGFVFAAGSAEGQFVSTGAPWYWNPVILPYGATGGTAASAEAQGLAEVIRAQGEFNRATAEAQQAQEAARSQYIDNQVKWLQAYHEHRRQGEERRAERNAANRATAQRRAEIRRQIQPELLGRSEVNPQTGALSFPRALDDPAFDEGRDRLQELFTERTASGATPESNDEIVRLATAMLTELRTRVHDTPAPDYIAARTFLERVRNEATVGA